MFPLYRVSFSSHVCIVIATYFVRTSFQGDYFAEWFQYRSKVITKYCNGKVLIFIVWRDKTIFKVKCDSMLLPFPIEECLRWFFNPKKQRFKKKTILIGFLILLLCFIQRREASKFQRGALESISVCYTETEGPLPLIPEWFNQNFDTIGTLKP